MKANGGFEITDYDSFCEFMSKFENGDEFLKNSGESAGRFVMSLSGASKKVISYISL